MISPTMVGLAREACADQTLLPILLDAFEYEGVYVGVTSEAPIEYLLAQIRYAFDLRDFAYAVAKLLDAGVDERFSVSLIARWEISKGKNHLSIKASRIPERGFAYFCSGDVCERFECIDNVTANSFAEGIRQYWKDSE